MENKILSRLFTFFAILTALVACRDDFNYPQEYDIPDGEGDVTCELTCDMPLSLNLGSRTPGEDIQSVKNLCVLIYNTDGSLYRKVTNEEIINSAGYSKTTETQTSPGDALTGNQAAQEEKQTVRVKFTIANLRYGRYYFYAVANMGNLDEYSVDPVDNLKSIRVKWNSVSIADNDQMFGYFTDGGKSTSQGFDAEMITFRTSGQSIHSWIKRTVSKVTVAFNGTGLRSDVTVYVRNVTIYDIPDSCYIGKDNVPTVSNLLNGPKNSELLANTSLSYGKDGVPTPGYKPSLEPSKEYTNWLPITNLNKTDEKLHAANAQSLFFFENMQGNKKGQGPNDKYYNKAQQEPYTWDGVGTNINDRFEGKDKEGNDSINDYKDRVPAGTYIEVEAYYVSNNPENTSHGPIKYRFMLGKDTEYDYNAQRNYHYKLTLGFKGWANQPDWHIIYSEEDPGIEVGPILYVSYLYNTPATMPVKLNGDCKKLEVEIIENNWAPCYENGEVPAQSISSSPAEFQFKWAKNVYDASKEKYGMNGEDRPFLGFLALQVPGNTAKEIPTDIIEHAYNYVPTGSDGKKPSFNASYGDAVQNELKTYYENNGQNRRVFSGTDISEFGEHKVPGNANNNWEVNKIVDTKGNESQKSRMMLIPLWTRNKSMINISGFSGNNPYEYFYRKAVIKITGTFNTPTDPNKEIVEYCTVYQVPRIVNPKGVWRKVGENSNFSVTLMQAENSNGQSNYTEVFSKGSWRAYIENPAGTKFKIDKNSNTNGQMSAKKDTIYGDTGSKIEFDIVFPGSEDVAIVHIDYNTNNCVHKILVKQGYDKATSLGGKNWYPYTLYGARSTGGTDGVSDTYTAQFTPSPLVIGSLFRRGKQSRGIRQWNNDQQNLGFMQGPNGAAFSVRNYNNSTGWRNWNQTWNQIGYRNDRTNGYTMGTFDGKYKLPTLQDFQNLVSASEFAFGVFYGNATFTQKSYAAAIGLTSYDNKNLSSDAYGARAVVAYDPTSAAQVIFPIGGTGAARRKGNTGHNESGANINKYWFLPDKLPKGENYRFDNPYFWGMLQYGDVCDVLSATEAETGNWWRPVVYNLPINPGAIYWIDKYQSSADSGLPEPCLGFDFNFFSFDVSPYTANNYMDACPIKLIEK